MSLESLRSYLLTKPKAVEEFPFDSVTLVIKVCGKMFALISTNQNPLRMNLKCLPEKAEVLREQYCSIIPVFWHEKNRVFVFGQFKADLVCFMLNCFP